MTKMNLHVRGDIYYVDFSLESKPSEKQQETSVQGGIRPAIIIQNNKGNATSKTTIVVPLTTATKSFAIHPKISSYNNSFALVEQMRVIDNSRLLRKVGEVNSEELDSIAKAVDLVFDFNKENEVVYVKLSGIGSECNNISPIPCLVVQAKEGFRYSTTLLVVPLRERKKQLSTHVKLPADELAPKFTKDSFAQFEQLIVISKKKIKSKQFKSNFSDLTINHMKKAFYNSISINP